MNYSISTAMVVAIFMAFDKKCYTSQTNLPALIGLLLPSGSATPAWAPSPQRVWPSSPILTY